MPHPVIDARYYGSDKTRRSRLVRVDVFPSRTTPLQGTDGELDELYDLITGRFKTKCVFAVVGWEHGGVDTETDGNPGPDSYWHQHWLFKFSDCRDARFRAALRETLEGWNGATIHRVSHADNKVLDMVGYIAKSVGGQRDARVRVWGDLPVTIDAARAYRQRKTVVDRHGQSKHLLGKCIDKAEQIRLCRQFILDAMRKHGVRMLADGEGYVNADYRPLSPSTFLHLLVSEGILDVYDPEQVNHILKQTQLHAESQTARMSRMPFPCYRPSRRYIQFADCIYDVFEERELPVDEVLVDENGIAVHPVYRFEKTMAEYDRLPDFYLRHVARLYTGLDYVRIFGRFVRPLVRKACSTLVTGPSNIGKTMALIPILEVYQNVLAQISADDGKFSWAGFAPHAIVIGEDVNPLSSGIFYDRAAFLNIVGGYRFMPPVKCANLERAFQPKVQLYTSNDWIDDSAWQPGYRERLEHVRISEDCPVYDAGDVTHEEVQSTILDELGSIIYYLVKRRDELPGIIDGMRQEQLPAYEDVVRVRPAMCAVARLHAWPDGVCVYCSRD